MRKKTIIALVLGLVFVVCLSGPAIAQPPKDKQLHFEAGLILSSLFYGLHSYGPNFDGDGLSKLEYQSLRRKEALKWGIEIAVVAGALKELADAAGMGTPEWEDFTYTVYGSLVGCLFCLVLDHILSTSFDFFVDVEKERIGLRYNFKM